MKKDTYKEKSLKQLKVMKEVGVSHFKTQLVFGATPTDAKREPKSTKTMPPKILMLRISEFPDSDFTNSRTAVSVNPGQSGDGWSLRCGYCSVVMISGFSGWVNWVLLPFFRMLSPVSSMRWALWMMRSRIASAMVGSPII
jgi:hypothetical protein